MSKKLLVALCLALSSSLVAFGCGGSSSNNSNTPVNQAPTLTPATGTVLTAGVVGVTYPSTSISAANGTAPYIFSESPNPPFPGMTITQTSADTVTLTGIPTQGSGVSPSTFQIQVTDANSLTYTATYTVYINGLAILPASPLTTAIHNAQYSQQLSVATTPAGVAPFTFSVVSPGTGSLPSGLTLSASGLLSGTPPAVGSSTFTVEVTDSSSPQKVGQQAYTLAIQ